ncbi:polysaccharide deacetylase family protein [Bradyrhizobium ottawaense]|uniref:polysaccharide deacetylase family protein n=1 Tax=Bradyrhizobium ottawaense TaxID=931866 RepID=UPI001FE0AABB|nr:polysaccharide deacetylase family protein [Bradyrhizobium ottawaense]
MSRNWPDDAQCVVCITIDYDAPSVDLDMKYIPLGCHSHGHYSPKCGVPRYLAMLERQGVSATFFIPGYDAELFPESVRSISKAGHEIAAHGYMHESFDLGDAEPQLLKKSHEILADLCGSPPIGWRNPGGAKTASTIRTLRSMNYIYDSSEKHDDLPFFSNLDGEPITGFINLPNNTSSLDDYPFFDVSCPPPSEVLEHWKGEFHAIYTEGGFFNLTLHSRNGWGSGSPSRVRAVDDLISFIKQYPRVRFARLDELARWCLDNPSMWRTEIGEGSKK